MKKSGGRSAMAPVAGGTREDAEMARRNSLTKISRLWDADRQKHRQQNLDAGDGPPVFCVRN